MNTTANKDMHDSRRVAEVLQEMKQELQSFVETRWAMLKAEVQEIWKTLKGAIPIVIAAAVLLGTAYLLLTIALVGMVAGFLPQNPYRWCIAFFAVGLLWGILGGTTAYIAWRKFKTKEMVPRRTLEVLHGDKVWIQSEVKNRI